MGKILKWTAIVVLVVIVVGGGVGAWLIYRAGREGNTALEGWIGNQLQLVVNGYLNPELRFAALDYQYPRTVVVTDAQLVAEDPAAPGRQINVIEARSLTIELAKIPSQGEPLVIQSIIADTPTLRLVEYDAGADGAALVGLTNLVRSDAAADDADAPPLSDVFRMRKVQLNNASVGYDPLDPQLPEMVLDDFTVDMDIVPDEKGWYRYETAIDRQPVFHVDAQGRMNLDNMQVEFDQTQLQLDLASEHASALPPNIQQLLQQHRVKGRLKLTLNGMVPLEDWRNLRMNAGVALDDANFAFDDYRLPVQRVRVDAVAEDGYVRIEPIDAQLLSGSITGNGGVTLNDSLDAAAQLDWQGLSLSEAIRGGDGQAQGEVMAGTISGHAKVELPLVNATTEADGAGHIAVREGRFASIPILSNVTGALRTAAKAALEGGGEAGDQADVEFQLEGDKAHLSEIRIQTSALAVAGRGDVGFDGTLNLTFQGGPLKKLGSKLGAVGDVLGKITDSIGRYEVTGTINEPQVTIALAAAPTDRAEDVENPRERPLSDIFEDMLGDRDQQRKEQFEQPPTQGDDKQHEDDDPFEGRDPSQRNERGSMF